MDNLLLWIGFHLLIFVLLALDLGVFHKKDRVIKMREALLWSGFWILCALLFNVFIYFHFGSEQALQFFTGFLIEKSLSVDNLFVLIAVFAYFQVPKIYQHRVLYWGLLGAMVMRIAFVLLGVALIEKFHWVLYILGAFLCITAVRLFVQKNMHFHMSDSWIARFLEKHLRFSDSFSDTGVFIRQRGKIYLTRIMFVHLVVETIDLVFAVDSIPAIFAITEDPFLVYTSNIFAILGLRSLYFVLADFMGKFIYLKKGLAAILFFTGLKMLFDLPISIEWSLLIVVAILALAVVLSLARRRKA
jgi:tellurite resistance protein TerC